MLITRTGSKTSIKFPDIEPSADLGSGARRRLAGWSNSKVLKEFAVIVYLDTGLAGLLETVKP